MTKLQILNQAIELLHDQLFSIYTDTTSIQFAQDNIHIYLNDFLELPPSRADEVYFVEDCRYKLKEIRDYLMDIK